MSGGFTLVEMAIVLAVIGLIAGIGADLMRRMERESRHERTTVALDTIEESMALFVLQHKRLPCPADGTAPVGHPLAGRENFEDAGPGGCTAQISGTVPYIALGIGAAATRDGWNRRITYRVDPVLTRDGSEQSGNCGSDGGCVCPAGGMDFSCVDPRLIGAGKGGIDDVLTRLHDTGVGLSVCLSADCPDGSELMSRESANAAAYVLISHGRTGLGAYTNGGTRTDSPNDLVSFNERPNLNGQALGDDQTGPVGGGFVDRERNDRDESELEVFFDDYVRRPSVLSVARAARLDPQSTP